MSTQLDTEIDPASSFCPNCLGKMSAGSAFCAACGSQTAIEISVAKIGDAKTAYFAARTLQAFAPQTIASVADLAKTLQVRNFHFQAPKGWAECEALVEALGAHQIAATIRHVVVVPTTSPLKTLTRKPAFLATAVIVTVMGVGYFMTAGKKNSTAPAAAPGNQAIEHIQMETDTDNFASEIRKRPDKVATATRIAEAKDEATPAIPPTHFSFDAVRRSIVTIKTQNGLGSGFVVHPGYILTNHHELEGLTAGGSVDVSFTDADGKPRTLPARVHRIAKDLDLGVVSCSQECEALPVLPLGRSVALDSGATVFAIGSPLGLSLTLSRGILSNMARNLDGALFMQSDVQVNPGNSGGPLLNERGEVVGVVTAKANGYDGISFILPIEYATQGPNAVLDGLPSPAPAYDAEFSARLAGLQKPDGTHGPSAAERAEEAAQDRIVLIGAAISTDNGYYVRFRIKWNPTSAMPPSGPFYIVIQQKSTGYKGTFQLTDVATPTKLGEMDGGALIYEFENVGKFQGLAKFDTGDKVSVRMRDDIFSNVVEMTRR